MISWAVVNSLVRSEAQERTPADTGEVDGCANVL